jgi:UDP-2,3-diacylglucosamine pyrophosphatase LpxH
MLVYHWLMQTSRQSNDTSEHRTERYRTIFLSDIHLGTRTAQAARLLDFLKHTDADTIYLVGDIVDFWRVRRGPHWPQTHNDVIQKLLRKVRHGTKLVFIPGNHDEGLRDYCGMAFGGMEIHQNFVHRTAANKSYMVMHGDEFDVVIRTAKWIAILGDRGYEAALWFNTPLNWVRRHCGLGYWSLSAYLKNSVKRAVSFIGAFEEAVASEARRHKVDGIICGHIHHAADRMIDGVHYLNSGDWVESCTAIVEHGCGRMEVIRWAELPAADTSAGRARVTGPTPATPVKPEPVMARSQQ